MNDATIQAVRTHLMATLEVIEKVRSVLEDPALPFAESVSQAVDALEVICHEDDENNPLTKVCDLLGVDRWEWELGQ